MSLVSYHVVGKDLHIPGIAYDYVMAGDGLWVEAGNPLISARVPVVEAKVRGLGSIGRSLRLYQGKVPQRLWDLALSVMLASPERERYIGIRWSSGYQLYVPEQDGTVASVKYQPGDNILVDLHSHAGMEPFFSGIDDRDEQGLKIYGVVGLLDKAVPVAELRIGVYGYYMPVKWADIFDGELNNVIDITAMNASITEQEAAQ